jgi:hypothetical protein
MTWGQIRFQIRQTAPELALQLIDEWMNGRYEQVLEAADWTGIRARATLATIAAYQSTTDTVTLTVGSTAVLGVGTAWLVGIVGMRFYRTGDTTVYTVGGWTDGTHLSLDRPYEGLGSDAAGTVYSLAGYVFMQNVYALPSDCRSVERVLDAAFLTPLFPLTPAGLDASAGTRALVGEPDCYAEIEDSPEASTPVLHQVEFYPPPLSARGYTVEYLRAAFAFDGQNLTQSPLPFVSSTVLLYGVRADVALAAGKMAVAQGYEMKFQEELKRLILVEFAQRRQKAPMQMADRFTRHRAARSMRGLGTTWRGGTPGGAA